MTDYLKKWPDDTANKKNSLIAQCDNALALVTVASQYGKNSSFLSDALNLLEQQLEEMDKTIADLVYAIEGRTHIPLWVMDALKTRGRKASNVVDLMEKNHAVLEFIKTEPFNHQKKALSLMRDNLKEMIFTLQGKRSGSNVKPPRE